MPLQAPRHFLHTVLCSAAATLEIQAPRLHRSVQIACLLQEYPHILMVDGAVCDCQFRAWLMLRDARTLRVMCTPKRVCCTFPELWTAAHLCCWDTLHCCTLILSCVCATCADRRHCGLALHQYDWDWRPLDQLLCQVDLVLVRAARTQ